VFFPADDPARQLRKRRNPCRQSAKLAWSVLSELRVESPPAPRSAFLAGDAPFLTKRYGRHGPFRGLLSALQALVRPHVAPVSVATAVGNSQIIEVAVDGLEGAGPLQVEDYICIFQQPRTAEHNLIFLQNQTHAAQVPNDRLDPVLRSTRQRLVFVGE